MIYYFDTSAIVKRYHREKGTEKIDEITEGEDEIYFSTIGIAETISALRRLKSSKMISKGQYERITGIFFNDMEKRYVPIPFDDSNVVKAISLIEKHDLRTLDALHLSAALTIKDTEPIFVSSDRKLLKAAQEEGFTTLNPEDE